MAVVMLAVLTKNRTNPAYVGARLGADRIAARFGYQTAHFVPHHPDDVEEQIALVDQALAQQPAALVLAPAHETRLAPAAARVQAAGIPLITIVSSVVGVEPLCTIGSDDGALAEAVTETLVQHLGRRGTLAIVNGHPDAQTSRLRTVGFKAALARHPSMTLAAECRGDYQRERAFRAFRTVLSDHAVIDGVVAANDYMAFGVLDALKEAGREAVVVGANATPEGIALIKQGRLLATAAFDAMSMSALAVEAVARHLKGEAVPGRIVLPAEIVIAGSIGHWDQPYDDRESIGWQEACRGC